MNMQLSQGVSESKSCLTLSKFVQLLMSWIAFRTGTWKIWTSRLFSHPICLSILKPSHSKSLFCYFRVVHLLTGMLFKKLKHIFWSRVSELETTRSKFFSLSLDCDLQLLKEHRNCHKTPMCLQNFSHKRGSSKYPFLKYLPRFQQSTFQGILGAKVIYCLKTPADFFL